MTAHPFRVVAPVASEDEAHAGVNARAGDTGSVIVERWSPHLEVPVRRPSGVPPMAGRPWQTWSCLLMRRVP